MPNALTAVFGADSKPFELELNKVQQMVTSRFERINSELASGSIPDNLVNVKKLDANMQAARFRIQAGWSQIVHSARATFDSLATGSNPFTIFLQQAPQVAQGFLQIGGSIGKMAFAIGGALVAVIGLGKGINYVVDKLYDVENVRGRGFALAAEGYHKARKEAMELMEIEAKAAALRLKHIASAMDSEEEYNAAVNENRAKNAKSPEEAHKLRVLALEGKAAIAQSEMFRAFGARGFDLDPSVLRKMPRDQQANYFKIKTDIENANQAVLDENRTYAARAEKDTSKPEKDQSGVVSSGQLNSLQRMGGSYLVSGHVKSENLLSSLNRNVARIASRINQPTNRGPVDGSRPRF